MSMLQLENVEFPKEKDSKGEEIGEEKQKEQEA